ncbi:hypothetical protein [Delftia tsuruhatensis]|uniref:hypothetical protein n=1 Tax=Delftia tsuruhatensis TaxID=180282 RepID=UPI0030D59170
MSVETSPVFLLDVSSGQPIAAALHDGITEQHLIDWEDQWVPALLEAVNRMKSAGIDRTKWPQSRHWNWRNKAQGFGGALANPGFSITCNGMTQGLMFLDLLKKARISSQGGKELVYIEYLENAPWNRRHIAGDKVRFAGVGSILIRAAIELSREEGFKGRIGLHSLPQANAWYANTCGMTDLGADQNYPSQLRYFEMTPEQAEVFISKGKTP